MLSRLYATLVYVQRNIHFIKPPKKWQLFQFMAHTHSNLLTAAFALSGGAPNTESIIICAMRGPIGRGSWCLGRCCQVTSNIGVYFGWTNLRADGTDRLTVVAAAAADLDAVDRIEVDVPRAVRVVRVERTGPVVAFGTNIEEVRVVAEPGSREKKCGAG